MSDTPTRKTTYVMLHSSGGGDSWSIHGQIDAVGSDPAIRQFLASHPTVQSLPVGGQWVAVPARSWQPVQIESKVVTTTKLVPVAQHGPAREPAPEGITA